MAYKQCYLAIFGKGVWVSKIARDFYKKNIVTLQIPYD